MFNLKLVKKEREIKERRESGREWEWEWEWEWDERNKVET